MGAKLNEMIDPVTGEIVKVTERFFDDSEQMELLNLAQIDNDVSWKIGDTIQRFYEIHKDKTRDEILSEAAKFLPRRKRSLRDYADVAYHYPLEIREQFKSLSFQHFRQALALSRSLNIPESEILKWAEEQVDILGRPATTDHMVENFLKESGKPSALQSLIDKIIEWVNNHNLSDRSLQKWKTAESALKDFIDSLND